MRVLILHDPVGEGARPDEQDTLVQAGAVAEALGRRGHEVLRADFSTDLAEVRRRVGRAQADVVFNLVEGPDGQGRLVHLAPSLLETCGVPFTGASSEAMFLSSSKRLTKRVLAAHGLPTPAWHSRESLRAGVSLTAPRYVVKSVWEHGSLGLESDSVVTALDATQLLSELESRLGALGGEAFVEGYVHGREFNVALLGGPQGPRCLPIPEIGFEGLAPGAPRIVGYRAKWDPDSVEWASTPRCFLDEQQERGLARRLSEVALATWEAFGLAGAARVDFRVDEAGQAFVIDVNANPCLTPDAGFAAALERAGIAYDEALERIVTEAVARYPA